MNEATESICPKGWTLPNATQIRSIGPDSGSTTYVSSFSPVLGGNYNASVLDRDTTNGYWWGSEAYNGAVRRNLGYSNDTLLYISNYGGRNRGYYIRCVQAP